MHRCGEILRSFRFGGNKWQSNLRVMKLVQETKSPSAFGQLMDFLLLTRWRKIYFEKILCSFQTTPFRTNKLSKHLVRDLK